jgi:hypothetical protein
MFLGEKKKSRIPEIFGKSSISGIPGSLNYPRNPGIRTNLGKSGFYRPLPPRNISPEKLFPEKLFPEKFKFLGETFLGEKFLFSKGLACVYP